MGEVVKKVEYDKTEGEKLKAFCSQCRRETSHLILKSVDCSGFEGDGGGKGFEMTIGWSNDYQIIQCQGCEYISFRHLNWCSEAQDYYNSEVNEYWDGTTIRLYPERSKNTRPLRDYDNVPPALERIYRESIYCFNNECFTLCAVGLRAILEGLCSAQGVSDGPVEVTKEDGTKKVKRCTNLQGKIAGLREKGILTEPHANILHEHRYLGNEAVHKLNDPSRDELALAIEIMEQTLDVLYELPDKAEELRDRKARRLRKENKSRQTTK